VSSSGAWVSYACGQTYDFNPVSGALSWHRDTNCEGGGGNTPVLAHGDLYVRDFSFAAVLKASNGKLRAGFSASGPPPAVDLTQSYDLQGSTSLRPAWQPAQARGHSRATARSIQRRSSAAGRS
jgi:hypothetical protein